MNESGLPSKKKRHHYVWRHYLRAWSEKDKIWCLRDGKIFQSGLMGVAQEKYFYKQTRLSASEIDLVRQIFIGQHKNDLMRPLLEGWISTLEYPFKFIDEVKKQVGSDQAIDDCLDVIQHNVFEEIHMHVEQSGEKSLNWLRQGSIEFYRDPDEALSFLFYICVQFFRTKGMRQTLLSAVENNPLGDLTNTTDLVSIILSTKLFYNLFMSGKWHLQLLENQTNIKFLTGDQPVLNTHCYERFPKEETKKFEFYYPVTPRLAVLVTETSSSETPLQLDEEQVEHYNSMIISISTEQLFATSEAQLRGVSTEDVGGQDQAE